MKKLSKSEIKCIYGGHPVIIGIYAGALGLYAVALEAMRAKGYHDGSKSASCN